MKRIVPTVLLGFAVPALLGPVPARSADLTVSADIASAHVFRGQTLSDEWVLQPEVLVSGLPAPLSIGVWGNLALTEDPPRLANGQFSRLDLYADYELPAWLPGLRAFTGFREFVYPLTAAKADREARLGLVADRAAMSPALYFFYGLDGAVRREAYVELVVGREWDFAAMVLDVSAGIGYRDDQSSGTRGFSHAWQSIAADFPVFSASVTAIQRIDSDVLPDPVYDVRLVGRLGVRKSF